MRTQTLLSPAFFALRPPAVALVDVTCACGLSVRFTWRGHVPAGTRARYFQPCSCGELHEHVAGRDADADAPVYDYQPRRISDA